MSATREALLRAGSELFPLRLITVGLQRLVAEGGSLREDIVTSLRKSAATTVRGLPLADASDIVGIVTRDVQECIRTVSVEDARAFILAAAMLAVKLADEKMIHASNGAILFGLAILADYEEAAGEDWGLSKAAAEKVMGRYLTEALHKGYFSAQTQH